MIDILQQQLSSIYSLDREYDIRDFLVTDPTLARVLGQGEMLHDTRETLLFSQADDELSLSLFLDREMLQRVESGRPLDRLHPNMLGELWQVIEGVSHFSCVAWKAASDRTLSLFELELQGEIDKFVTTMLISLQQANKRLSRNLHGLLFDNVSFRDDLSDEQAGRYYDANDYAARYCYGLREQLQQDESGTLDKLRTFYRLQSGDKVSHSRSEIFSGTH
jgi:hypothetical protein